jgi:peptidoglycan-associated lipoprotein
MKNILPVCATLAMVLGMAPLYAVGQTSTGGAPQPAPDKFDVAANFTYKVAKIASTTTRFVLPGGSLDATYNFGGKVKGLGLVIDLNGESKSNIEPGVNLTQFSVMGGVRYTFHLVPKNPHAVDLYGQFLGGGVFASNSIFPGPSSTTTSANSSAIQLGGGANIRLTRRIALRLLEADFISTKLPNVSGSRQYDVRFSNGVVFRF